MGNLQQSKSTKAVEALLEVMKEYKEHLPPTIRVVLSNSKYIVEAVDESPMLQEAIGKWLDKLSTIQTS